jgi:hypothetical protein
LHGKLESEEIKKDSHDAALVQFPVSLIPHVFVSRLLPPKASFVGRWAGSRTAGSRRQNQFLIGFAIDLYWSAVIDCVIGYA